MDRYFRQHSESVCAAVNEPPVDDATAAYILETRRSFEDLRQVAAQLAGLLVLSAAGSKSAGPDHPIFHSAGQLYRESLDQLRRTRVTPRARKHHRHLLEAAGALAIALEAASRSVAIDPVLAPLRSAYAHLADAARELPGFAMVALEQGCCGRTS
jgi:hypothetical protein